MLSFQIRTKEELSRLRTGRWVWFGRVLILMSVLLRFTSARMYNTIRQVVDSPEETQRRLTFEMIAGYFPQHLVTDINAIDLDQKGIKDQLSLETVEGYQAAERIYLEGAFTSSIARLNLTLPLSENLELGDKVIGTSSNAASEVEGTLIDGLDKGSRVIKVKYDISRDQDNFSKCQVAANPTPNFDGCFADEGLLVISGVSKSLSYSYDPVVDNYSDQSLARLSTDASEMMETCNEGCPYVDFNKFRDYYGTGDYAHRWIMAAFDGNMTEFSNGNADFGSYGTEGRYEAITKGTAYMSIWMAVIGEMEKAVFECRNNESKSAGMAAWDRAVAYYTGSLEGPVGTGDGVLLYALADKRCANFKTCSEDKDAPVGTSYVNIHVFRQFNKGQGRFREKKCDNVEFHKERIVKFMTVPLVQGALRYAHLQGYDTFATGEKAEAEGAAFSAAILPMVYACGEQGQKDATIIYENLMTGHEKTNFMQVRAAFERNYDCLGITCEEVGGIWNELEKSYEIDASPCGKYSTEEDDNPELKLVFGLGVGGLLLVLLIVVVSSFVGKKAAPTPSIHSNGELI